ncbi:substrate-binding domain-containing protein [Oceaniferula spumae]|uniref:substrate-binding domain-containing protein n=1 Tax=Oceaniferula spumae TaxID=2979115 RepID=UPI003F4F06D4
MTDSDTFGEMEPREIGVGWQGEGLVLYRATEEELKDFKDRGIVVTLLSSEGPDAGFPRVIPDNVEAGRMAAKHLMGLGFENYAFIARGETLYKDLQNAPGTRVYARKRLEGFRQRLSENGHEVAVHLLPGFPLWEKNAWKDVEKAVAGFLETLPTPTGLFAGDDALAAVVLRAAERIGKVVPSELAVLGFGNDVHYCHANVPALTSIGYPGREAGYLAATMIERMLAGDDLQGEVREIKPEGLHVRDSTDVIAIRDPEVARLVRWIRRNAPKRAILVSELNDLSELSMTSIKERMREHLGHGPKEEVMKVRLHHLQYLLEETKMPLKEITKSMQFSSGHEMSRFFHRETGKRPSSYRQ